MSSILSRLETIQIDLEKKYVVIGENFSGLMSELDSSLKTSRGIVNDFRNRVNDGTSSSLTGRIMEIENIVEGEIKRHGKLMEESGLLLNRLIEVYEKLYKMNKPISEIQDAAELMTLLAINSMVVAVQAGSEGGGFTCITEELKNASLSAHNYAGQIKTYGELVSREFEQFKSLSGEILENEKMIFKTMEEKLLSIFSDFKLEVSDYVGSLEHMDREIDRLRPALMNIMQGIQNQDIVRQSLDHVIISIKELEVGEYTGEAGETGAFLLKKQLFSLGLKVLEDVHRWLESDLELLNAGVTDCSTILGGLESGKNVNTDGDGGQKDFSSGFQNFRSQIFGIMEMTRDDQHLKNELFSQNETLMQSMGGLRSHIDNLFPLVELFHNINIMARIEIARTSVFTNIEDSVNRMGSINDRIENAVNKIISVEELIKQTGIENEQAFEKVINTSRDFVQNLKENIKIFLESVEEADNFLNNSLEEFNMLSGGFFNLFSDSRKMIEEISSCYRDLLTVENDLRKEVGVLDSRVESLNLQESILEENRLRIEKILEKFTIFRHKKEAGTLTGVEVAGDEFLEESSIVLF